jgi:hypothetical protein
VHKGWFQRRLKKCLRLYFVFSDAQEMRVFFSEEGDDFFASVVPIIQMRKRRKVTVKT